MEIYINDKKIILEKPVPVVEAAAMAGVEIPTLCYLKGEPHLTSCMICLVKDATNGKLFPSCSIQAQEGMKIITEDEEIITARRTALELLLSEHVGDCEAPCQIACPAHMNIPEMNRLISLGKFTEAYQLVLKDIALPGILGRICPAPCEGACKRRPIDDAVSICLLKRFTYDEAAKELESIPPQIIKKQSVAIVGAGPAGLAAAYYLRTRGYQVDMFDKESVAGGALREIEKEKLPDEVLNNEIDRVFSTGVRFHAGVAVDSMKFDELLKNSDALVIATGDKFSFKANWNIPFKAEEIDVNKDTWQTSNPKLFIIGNAIKSSKLAIRSLAQGKEVAFSIDQYLQGISVTGEIQKFNSRFGKLMSAEFTEYIKESTTNRREEPIQKFDGFTVEQAKSEADRCLHCDCRKKDNCGLRDYSDQYQAKQKRFSYGDRANVIKMFHHETIVYEPEKCIKCGICIRITETFKERYGLTFIGRGFDVKIGVPFGEDLKPGLEKAGMEVAKHCPTGALSVK